MSATTIKCACPDCVCEVEQGKGIQRDGQTYCDEACASHHKDGSGCHHAGCACHG
ncbi:metallothionein [Granulibacter bethesdensis]|uniref:metallothionein n=1 Tax=Granulibacter bethesdensis TaxID=364410 RepID=UPI0009332292|nr:metallothionein [Granulibacter bethesdensis]